VVSIKTHIIFNTFLNMVCYNHFVMVLTYIFFPNVGSVQIDLADCLQGYLSKINTQ